MSKNPIAGMVLVGIIDLKKDLEKIGKKIIDKYPPHQEVPEEIMQEIKVAIQKGVETITNSDELSAIETLTRIIKTLS